MVTARLQSAAQLIFGPAHAPTALARLDQHFSADRLSVAPELLERITAAALKQSEGSLENLDAAMELGSKDWRDLLMAAGFGHDLSAHDVWFRQVAEQEAGVP